jgi:acyl-CoA synthetase (AMP-forming)/AMP-acid ligase II
MSGEKDYSTLVELLQYRSQHQSNRTAYTFLTDGETKSVSVTYHQLDLQAKAIASHLQSKQLDGNTALLIYPYDGGLEFIAAFFGCLYAKVIAVPCHPPRNRHASQDLAARLASSQAKIVLTTKNLLPKLKSQLGTIAAPLEWLTTDDTPAKATDWREPNISSDTLAFLQYTSGSTGVPKGVMVTHGCVLHNQKILKLAFCHTEKSVGVGWLPLFHDMGLIGNVLQSMYVGMPCIFLSPIAFVQKPVRWLQAISHYGATTSGAPNFAYELLCHHVTAAQKQNLDLSSWDLAFTGAEPVRVETIERFFKEFASCGFRSEAFYPCYGMAEATLLISGGEKTAPPIIKYVEKSALEKNQVVVVDRYKEGVKSLVSCGKPWLDDLIAIANPHSLTQCTDNQVGEIWFSSPGIGKGYWNLSEETSHTFQASLKDNLQAGSFLRTGDLGFLAEGELFITGRLNDVLVFWGFNHYPQHIEQTVENCHSALKPSCSAAFAIEVDGEEKLVIVQELDRNYRHILAKDIAETIRWAVFDQHLIDVYAIALLKPGSIPKTSSGKIQRRTCKQKYLDSSLDILSQWHAPQKEPSNLTSLINSYLNPLTHAKRYLTFTQGSLRRWLFLIHRSY